jgi:hypothetical protein
MFIQKQPNSNDLQARKCAVLLDIPLIGSGLLNLARPAIERLMDVGLHINSAMLARILIRIGEGDKVYKAGIESD